MCGIVAYSGTDNYNADKLKTLIIINSWNRGTDSTGFWNKKQNLLKDTKNAVSFLKDENIDDDNIFIGHCRSKTYGTIIKENAHPFMCDSIVMVHNGTIINHNRILNEINETNRINKVDSQAICEKLAVDKNPLVLSEIDGSAAIVFTDTLQENTLFVFRNKERPLSYGYINNNMYISSEDTPLEIINCENITEFEENILYKIQNGLIVEQVEIKNIPLKEIKENNNSFQQLKNKVINLWVKTDSTYKPGSSGIYDISINNWYYIINMKESKKEGTEVTIKDDKDKIVSVPWRFFSYDPYYRKNFKKGDLGTLTCDLQIENKTVGLTKDECEITDIECFNKKYQYEVINKRNNNKFLIKTEWLMPK